MLRLKRSGKRQNDYVVITLQESILEYYIIFGFTYFFAGISYLSLTYLFDYAFDLVSKLSDDIGLNKINTEFSVVGNKKIALIIFLFWPVFGLATAYFTIKEL